MELVEFLARIPEEQIALDELLLMKAETGEVGETLRFWTSRDYFIVVGRAGKVSEDCFLKRCKQDEIKIIRRISGGGTVLQGEGCLNYSAILSYERGSNYEKIDSSYHEILGSIAGAFKAKGLNIKFHPISDLALGGKKISGNAQARKRKYFLHHGTILFNFDLDKVTCYLKHPGREPEYRKSRAHSEFLTNIPLEEEELKTLIKGAFSCSNRLWQPGDSDIKFLNEMVLKKYATREWNFAF